MEILTYSPSIYSIIRADLSLIQLSNLWKTCWKDLLRPYLLRLINILVVESKQTVANSLSAFYFCLLTFIVIWCLKPFILINKSLNKSSILGLLAANWADGSYVVPSLSSIISLLYFLNIL